MLPIRKQEEVDGLHDIKNKNERKLILFFYEKKLLIENTEKKN